MRTTYRVTAWWRPLTSAGGLVLFAAVALVVVVGVIDGDTESDALLWPAVVAWLCGSYSTMWAYRVDVDGTDAEFRCFVRRRRNQLGDISSIRLQFNGFVKIQFGRGPFDLFYLYSKLEDWDEFVDRVKAANPDVKVTRSG